MAQKLKRDDLAQIAGKLMELGNLTIAALGIGQILNKEPSLIAAGVGIGVFVGLYFFAIQLLKRG